MRRCLYFFDNDVIMFDYDYICMFDGVFVPILMLETGLGVLVVLLFCSKPCDGFCGTIFTQS